MSHAYRLYSQMSTISAMQIRKLEGQDMTRKCRHRCTQFRFVHDTKFLISPINSPDTLDI